MSVIYINSYQFASAPPVGPTDPDFASVSLLLHGDGTNGSTTILDSSPSPKTVTAVGNAQISTAQSKFGGSSLAFDGSGDYLRIPSDTSLEFGTSDFTVEFWWRRTSSGPGGFVDLGLNYGGIGMYQTTFFFVRIAGSDVYIGSLFPVNQWVHVALSRAGTSLRLFFDGIQQGSTITNSTNLVNTFGVAAVGAFINSGNYFPTPAAYVDDLRITKGVARYTANFTPPTAPFPDA